MQRRETRQREAILDVLRSADGHPTADWIYSEVRRRIPNISKGTVYRNLAVLRDKGEISELNLSGTVTRYERRKLDHYHFRCVACGRVFDVDAPVDNEINERLAKRTGLVVESHQLEFRGLCQDCQQKRMTGEHRPTAT